MQVILLENIDKLGTVGEEIRVRDGFGRNFLVPQGKALVANNANRKAFEAQRRRFEERAAAALAQAKATAEQLATLELKAQHAAGNEGKLFGSVTSHELAEMIEAAGVVVDRRLIHLANPIRNVGEHTFTIRLHPQVVIDLTVVVEAL
ncbi:MAG: 50S ribosomal protein L9 [Alphaproteobacteria bacterium CG_4_10_14_0_2_um_filter_63_37]|nr:MAG: 50S ribosomal protein L9 [Proteobacteria bacterium CG1_02_64_396]PJA24609.1 MAG: 50S ribosomal protein L9 [Alphaproteobacteria bacterium CG_4_10_14_0_2_um_filter_63_37]